MVLGEREAASKGLGEGDTSRLATILGRPLQVAVAGVAQPQRPMARGSVDGDLRRADTEVVRLRIALVAPLLPFGTLISGCGSSEDATGDVSGASTGSMASDDSVRRLPRIKLGV